FSLVIWRFLLYTHFPYTTLFRSNFRSFGLVAGRDALGVLTPANRADDTSSYRNLLNDAYQNYGAELRLLKRYSLFQQNSHFLIGDRKSTRLNSSHVKISYAVFCL